MSFSKALKSSIRRLRSVVLLAITISLLFYYTFQNEINMLNSFAENEFIPSTNPDLAADEKSDGAIDGKDLITNAETSGSDLSDPKILREKNKYFPLLLQDASKDPSLQSGTSNKLDTSALLTYKEKYPVLNEVSLPPSFSYMASNYPKIQSSQYETGGFQQNDILAKIRRILGRTWAIDVLPSKVGNVENRKWPITLIDSMDTLYIMGLTDDFEQAVKIVSETNFKVPPDSMETIDIPDCGTRLLGGLLSSFELSQKPILLSKAIEVADFLLRSFDTPNRIPILQYKWRSKTNNKFPYQNSYSAGLTSMTLELLRLSQITNVGRYFDAVERIYKTISKSTEEFAIPYMLPLIVDASGCSLISREDVLSGKHLRDSKGMKSIDQNLNFVHCHQTGRLLRTTADKNGDEEIFRMDAPEQSLYANMLKSLHLLNGNDLLRITDDYSEGEDKKQLKNERESGQKTKEKLKADVNKYISIKQIVTKAMDQINEYMTFTPLSPLAKNLTFISTVKAKMQWVPATQQSNVQLMKMYDMHHERCSLASTLGMGSRLLDGEDYMTLATNVTSSCFEIFKLFKGMYIEDAFFDPCDAEQCLFEGPDKFDKLSHGYYQAESTENIVGANNGIILTDEDVIGDIIKRVIVFGKQQGPSTLNLNTDDMDEEAQKWKKDPSMPLWINKMGKTSILSSNLIESIFYLYRITGEMKWRKMGLDLFKTTSENFRELNVGAKGVWKVREMHEDLEGKSLSEWYSRTLKYYYLLFMDASDYALDNYVFTSGGHLLKREPKFKENNNLA